MKSEEALEKLHRVMGQLGFESAREASEETSSPKQVHALGYTDRQGNRVDLSFSLEISPGGSGLVIKASFNNETREVWNSLDAVIESIPAAVAEWLKPGPPRERVDASRARRTKRGGTGGGLSAAVVLDDIRAGLDDQDLMAKHGLSHRRLLSLMSKLVWEGLLTQEELARRKSLARTVFLPVYQCRLCQEMSFEKGAECPRCGGPMVAMNRK